jgi:predicted P-loop ATPase
MKYDGTLDLALGKMARSRVWKNTKIQWSELVERLSETNKTNETYKEFMSANKAEQSQIKDVGGYVGGYLRQGRRKPENVIHRQLLTLDIDFATAEFWDDFTFQFDNAAVLHGTHKHSTESPRLRLVMPLDREVSPDEYVAISRQVAGTIGIDLFDNTTFETNRLMFWPSTPSDVDYYVEVQDGAWLAADEILNTYVDWTDSSAWPTAQAKLDEVHATAKKQEDPHEKRGLIGAFCRAYTIAEAIAEYLPEEYVGAGQDRFTYTKGTAAAGAIVYDDKFLFSHHGTDPTGGHLCNAFDLVRVHKFGHLDGDSKENRGSMRAMEELAGNDKTVKALIATESMEAAKYEFSQDEPVDNDEDVYEWMKELEVDGKGKYLSTATNINLVFAHDRRLKGLFRQNDFDGKKYVFDSLPWRKIRKPEPIKNVDFSGVRNYIESIYNITGNLKIDDALTLEFERNIFHPVREYLNNLDWDGETRIDNMLVDYFGADDNLYTREAIAKMLVGAVGRILRPGIKFDLVLTIVGEQGEYKSTFINKLGKEWFSDTFMTVHGKEALEQIQGAWLIEMAELAGLKKAEVESVKHFISKQEDVFRPAYARASERYPRQCVFFATTNEKNFLRDPSGNRRFMPISTNAARVTKSVWDDLTEREVNQIWAEAVVRFKGGEPLYLSREAEDIAKKEQRRHSDTDERAGLIEEFLNTPLPEDWKKRDLYDRRTYLNDPLSKHEGEQRQVVCVAEVWCECLSKEKQDMDRYKTRDINEILKSLEDWQQSKSTKTFKNYGKQKFYFRKTDEV